jgi:curved DNA-binding protein CbpA
MENRRNYYRILQVQPGAPVEIIRASYRTLMQRLKAHPDLGGDHWNAAMINEAYAVLTDPEKRAQYDREVRASVEKARAAAGHGAPEAAQAAAEPERCLFCQAPHRSRPNRQANALCERCGSPLHRATMRRLTAAGQRAIERLPRHHPLVLYTTWPQAEPHRGESRDLSLNGISFATVELLTPEAIVKLDSAVCRAVIEVTNVRVENDGADGLWLVGAQFLSVIFPRSRGAFVSARA